jgi:hypothetical protein
MIDVETVIKIVGIGIIAENHAHIEDVAVFDAEQAIMIEQVVKFFRGDGGPVSLRRSGRRGRGLFCAAAYRR